MRNQAMTVVQTMFGAFAKGDIDGITQTVADTSTWTYHGTHEIPYAGEFVGKAGVAKFIQTIFETVDIQDFQVDQFIADGNTVVVLGSEQQKIKANGEILSQKWVQVYQVEDGLITRMDEFANTAHAEKLFTK
ncbi:nuclear transport factor 2 family protein [Larkinella humicola]|uniref:Nuclear transport factor 2 family protein n=1 Tax=Larkinella humicola TaxID=2607654 RepID=A0A5N1JBX5_9BACT|nr:nuclear transport factor 2 family protein [Larkinella humicola]KAA9349243.1 nuclear transport factor 2 family protein [Larkinella humicola]